MDDSQITTPIVKVVTAAGFAIGGYSLQEISHIVSIIGGLIAAILALHYMGEWYWKKFWRPLFRRHRWFGFAPAPETRPADLREE